MTTGEAGVPRRGEHLPYLDGYRAVAALFVLAYHVVAWRLWVAHPGLLGVDGAAWLERLGNYGVCLFFLLSGLVLYKPFVASALAGEPGPPTWPYYARRVLRIYPAYVVALTAWYALGAFPLAGTVAPSQYLWQYFLLQNYVDGGLAASLPIAWTLSVEISFYAVLPLIAVAIRALPGGRSTDAWGRLVAQLTGLGVLALLAMGFRLYLVTVEPTWGEFPSLWLPNYLDWFALGMLLAVLHEWRSAGNRLPRWVSTLAARPGAAWGMAALLFWVLVLMRLPLDLMADPLKAMLRFPVSGVSAFLLLLPAVLVGERRRALQVFETPVLVYLGAVSYGIYLWHTLVLRWIAEQGWRLGTLPLLIVVTSASVVLAALSYHLLERPVQRLGRTREVPKPAHIVLAPGSVGR